MKKIFIAILFIAGTFVYGAERIVSLAPSVTEILYFIGAGDEIVGNTTACDYPEEAKKTTKVGEFLSPNIEKTISLAPTVIVGMGLNEKKINTFKEMGIKTINYQIDSIDDIFNSIKEIGKAVGREKEAFTKAEALKARYKTMKARGNAVKNKKKIFVLIWNNPLMTAGKKSMITEMIESAGGINIAGDVDADYPVYSKEQVILKKPEYILVDHLLDVKSTGLAGIKIIDDINADLLFRPGPRIFDGIEKLYQKFDNE